jgi:CubicO group peptidase (beta-lactamase class C family)
VPQPGANIAGEAGITTAILPTQTPDPLTSAITVRQLATQMSGLRRDFGTDLRTMAARLGRTTTPTRDDTVRYLYGEPLDHAPGTVRSSTRTAPSSR